MLNMLQCLAIVVALCTIDRTYEAETMNCEPPYLCLAVVNQLLVPEVWVHFHLYCSRLDASIRQQSVNLFAAEV